MKPTFFHDASSKPGGRGLWEAETRRGKMRRSKAISEKFETSEIIMEKMVSRFPELHMS